MPALPPEMIVLLAPFAQLFSERVWLHAQGLVVGAILALGNRTVSSCLRVMGLAWEEHFTNFVWACREALHEAGVFPIPRFTPDLAEIHQEPENALPLAA